MKIELRRAAMTYQAPDGEVAALRDVTFGVADGEFVSIVGPSGCGKSTLLALIAGIEHPSGGEVLVDGEPVRAPTGKAGLMPQRDQLFDWRTIWGNVTLGLEVRHENTPEHRGGVHDLLEQYQLAGFARKLPNQLSGGMRQRCALIRTLATSPDVLLLDEPFSALDYQTRLAVSGDISQIIRREHKTALLVTHDISEAIGLWWSELLSRVLDPYLVVLNALPKTALGPVFIVWIGAGTESIIAMTIAISIFVTILNMHVGFLSTDREKIRLMQTLGATRHQILWRLVIPANYATLFNTLRVNVGLSWVGVIMGEFLVSKAGLGYLIVYGSQVFNMDLVMATVLVLAVAAVVMYQLVLWLEKFFKNRLGVTQ